MALWGVLFDHQGEAVACTQVVEDRQNGIDRFLVALVPAPLSSPRGHLVCGAQRDQVRMVQCELPLELGPVMTGSQVEAAWLAEHAQPSGS